MPTVGLGPGGGMIEWLPREPKPQFAIIRPMDVPPLNSGEFSYIDGPWFSLMGQKARKILPSWATFLTMRTELGAALVGGPEF